MADEPKEETKPELTAAESIAASILAGLGNANEEEVQGQAEEVAAESVEPQEQTEQEAEAEQPDTKAEDEPTSKEQAEPSAEPDAEPEVPALVEPEPAEAAVDYSKLDKQIETIEQAGYEPDIVGLLKELAERAKQSEQSALEAKSQIDTLTKKLEAKEVRAKQEEQFASAISKYPEASDEELRKVAEVVSVGLAKPKKGQNPFEAGFEYLGIKPKGSAPRRVDSGKVRLAAAASSSNRGGSEARTPVKLNRDGILNALESGHPIFKGLVKKAE